MKQIYILTIILFSLNSYSQDCNIGNETTNSDFEDGKFVEDFLLGVKYTLNQEGTLTFIGNGTGEVGQFNFTQTEKNALIAFLNTLTDEQMISDEKYSDPFN